VPHLEHPHRLRVGCGYNPYYGCVACDWTIENLSADAGNEKGFRVEEIGRGYDPGATFFITPQELLKRGIDCHGSCPTVGPYGKLAWSVPRDFQTDELICCSPEDIPKLEKMLASMERYLPDSAEK
jgi:hypothetical protein